MSCGAVGDVLASGWLRAGHDLTIIARDQSITQAVSGQLLGEMLRQNAVRRLALRLKVRRTCEVRRT